MGGTRKRIIKLWAVGLGILMLLFGPLGEAPFRALASDEALTETEGEKPSKDSEVSDEGNTESADTPDGISAVPVSAKSAGLDLVLVMDHSVSIRNNAAAMTARDSGARSLVALAAGTDSQIGVVYFSGGYVDPNCAAAGEYPEFIDDGSQLYQSSMQSLKSAKDRTSLMEDIIGKGYENVSGLSTNIATGLEAALEMLNTPNGNEKAILLFCDGKNDTRDDIEIVENQYNEETKAAVLKAKERGVKIYCIYSPDNNEKQSDVDSLKQIVTYYDSGAVSLLDNERFVEQKDTASLQETFVKFFEEITSIEYSQVKTSSDGSYTLKLPNTDVQAVSIVFQGDGIQITDIQKDGASIASEGSFFSSQGSSACVYLDQLDAESSYRIVTNQPNQTGYLMYNHGIALKAEEISSLGEILKDAEVSLRVFLYDHSGNSINPDSYHKLDIQYVNDETGEALPVASELTAAGSYFEAAFQVPSDGACHYEIALSYGTERIGSCSIAGGSTKNEDASIVDGLFFQIQLPKDFIADGQKTALSIPLKDICEDPEKLYDFLAFSFEISGEPVSWLSVDSENSLLLVKPPAFEYQNLMPVYKADVLAGVTDISGNRNSAQISFTIINTWGCIRLVSAAAAVILLLALILIVKKARSAGFKKKLSQLGPDSGYDAMKKNLADFKASYKNREKAFLASANNIKDGCRVLLERETGVSFGDDWIKNSQNEIDKKNMTPEESEIFQLLMELNELTETAKWDNDTWKAYLDMVKEWKKKHPSSWLSLQNKKKYKKAYKLYSRIARDYDLLVKEQEKPLKTASDYEKKLKSLNGRYQKLSRKRELSHKEFYYSLLAEKPDGEDPKNSILAGRSCFDGNFSRRKRPFSLLDDMLTDKRISLRQYFKEQGVKDTLLEDKIMIYADDEGLCWKSREIYGTASQGAAGRILFRSDEQGKCTALLVPGIPYVIQFDDDEIWYLHVLGQDI